MYDVYLFLFVSVWSGTLKWKSIRTVVFDAVENLAINIL